MSQPIWVGRLVINEADVIYLENEDGVYGRACACVCACVPLSTITGTEFLNCPAITVERVTDVKLYFVLRVEDPVIGRIQHIGIQL